MHPDIPIVDDTRKHKTGHSRGLNGFGCCKTIKNVRRYSSFKGIVVRQVGAGLWETQLVMMCRREGKVA